MSGRKRKAAVIKIQGDSKLDRKLYLRMAMY